MFNTQKKIDPSLIPIASNTLTRGIRILVRPQLSQTDSKAEGSLFVYSYFITIINEGMETVQLTSRHWIIKDGFNKVNHVVGDGVVGQKPVMRPGEKFDYSSFCPLNTPTGSMKGSFQMANEKGESFEALIDEFVLRDHNLVN